VIRTRICELLNIEHPIGLGGMGSATNAALVSAVSNAGALGALGCHRLTPEEISERVGAVRQATPKPFGLNFILFDTAESSFAQALSLRPAVMQFAWARPDQDLEPFFDRAHRVGCKVTYMASNVPEAVRAAKAGADIIIAQGSEGGGHVGWMCSMPLVPMVVDAVSPTPVIAAGGFADGRGLAAALSLGAEGILLGTRFLATVESPLHPHFKQAIVKSDGHDTQLSEIPDIAAGLPWPGAMTRSRRNRFIERWAGREWALRAERTEALVKLRAARETGDVEEGPLSMGQDAGLIHDIPSAAEIVQRIAREADEVLTVRLRDLICQSD
jgi:NAD(P)H-dependent flavin oxidoreductase YrpB (nitropropane dioxygenase family)